MPIKRYGSHLELVEYENEADRLANTKDLSTADRGRVLCRDVDTENITLWDGDSWQPFGGASSTKGPVTWFVRDLDGDDADNGTKDDSPLESLTELATRLPHIIAHDQTVRMDDHQGAGYDLPRFGNKIFVNGARIRLRGDGGGRVGADPFTEIATGTAGAGTGAARVVTTGLSIDANVGQAIIMTDGAAATSRRFVVSNTTTDLVPIYDYQAATGLPAQGDTFRVVTPSVEIAVPVIAGDDVLSTQGIASMIGGPNAQPLDAGFLSDQPDGLYIENIRFTAAGATRLGISTETAFLGVEIAANVTLHLARCGACCGRGASANGVFPGLTDDREFESYGLDVIGNIKVERATLADHWVFHNATSFDYGAILNQNGGRYLNTITLLNACKGFLFPLVARLLFDNTLRAEQGAFASIGGGANCVFATGANPSLRARSGGLITDNGASGSATTGPSMLAIEGGRIQSAGAVPSVTRGGAVTDISVGGTPADVTAASLSSPGDHLVATDLAIIQRTT